MRNLVDQGLSVVAVAPNRPSCGGAAFARESGQPESIDTLFQPPMTFQVLII